MAPKVKYVMRILGVTNYVPPVNLDKTPCYLHKCDIEAHNGRGSVEFCFGKKQAMKFNSVKEVFELWRKESTVRPRRPDGKPNRPISALTMAVELYDENAGPTNGDLYLSETRH